MRRFRALRLLAYPRMSRAVRSRRSARRCATCPPTPRCPARHGGEGEEGLHPLDRTMLHTFDSPRSTPRAPLSSTSTTPRNVYEISIPTFRTASATRGPHDRGRDLPWSGSRVRCLRRADGRWAATLRLSLSAPHISEVGGLDDEALLSAFRTDLDWICARSALSSLASRGEAGGAAKLTAVIARSAATRAIQRHSGRPGCSLRSQ